MNLARSYKQQQRQKQAVEVVVVKASASKSTSSSDQLVGGIEDRTTTRAQRQSTSTSKPKRRVWAERRRVQWIG